MNVLSIFLVISFLFLGVIAKSQNTVNEVIASYKYETKQLKIDDSTSIAYIDEGKGSRTLIMIHGLATYLPSWYPQFDYLKESNRCIALDLPGYGRSSKGDYPATMTYYASVIKILIEELKIENPVLIGHSMGGQIAVTTVLQYPELFKELILLAPAGFETFTEQQAALLKAATTVDVICNATNEQVRANWKLNFYDMPETVEFMIEDRLEMKEAADFRLYGQSVVRSVSGMLDEPIFDRLKDLKTKTLVVYGANDILIPNRYLNPQLTTKGVAEKGVEQIENATLSLVDNCGHFMTYDQPEAVNEIIDSFLEE
ncbi:MAG: alpha/beta hydrolase [Flammeovirgaceae bacterium]|nr:alpha/beta hydrolase [Flammeovirgaceae bacterium]MBE61876.1 alpha/beta hydrolase [Flammeovirgaceae bacterium]MBR10607.1 alpha/beta hydrolase [Rickettsiales bacterium]HCX23189.1 alpha/beta hydrolase [Cytophagales bacterium]